MSRYISITGSKGKTTILFLLQHIIKVCNKEKNILSVSSTEGMYYNNEFLRRVISNDYFENKTNNGEPLDFDYFITEATSNMLMKGYYDEINTSIAVFTGIEEAEHIDVHKTFENYLSAKKKLFDNLKDNSHAIINVDNPYYEKILEDCKCKNVYKYGFTHHADYRISIVKLKKNGQKIIIRCNNNIFTLSSKLLGNFNALNMTAVFIISTILNLNIKQTIQAIKSFKGVNGRFHRFYLSNNNIVIIDYAHTPDSLRKVLETIKSLYSDYRIVTVFGCGGNKSVDKRPLMGDIVTQLSNFAIITNDNSRYENEMNIVNNIIYGINPQKKNYKVILSRKNAIKEAILTTIDSVILIAGKGAERFTEYSEQNIGDVNNRPKLLIKKGSDYQLLYEVASENGLNIIAGRTKGLLRFMYPR